MNIKNIALGIIIALGHLNISFALTPMDLAITEQRINSYISAMRASKNQDVITEAFKLASKEIEKLTGEPLIYNMKKNQVDMLYESLKKTSQGNLLKEVNDEFLKILEITENDSIENVEKAINNAVNVINTDTKDTQMLINNYSIRLEEINNNIAKMQDDLGKTEQLGQALQGDAKANYDLFVRLNYYLNQLPLKYSKGDKAENFTLYDKLTTYLLNLSYFYKQWKDSYSITSLLTLGAPRSAFLNLIPNKPLTDPAK